MKALLTLSKWRQLKAKAKAQGVTVDQFVEGVIRGALADEAGRVRTVGHVDKAHGSEFLVSFKLSIPESVLKEFQAHVRGKAARFWSGTFERCLIDSIRSGTPVEGTRFWDRPFNRPLNGVRSEKVRLHRVRQLYHDEPCRTVTLILGPRLWSQIGRRAEHRGITPDEHCVLCIDYHAALYRLAEAKRTETPADRFARALAAESRRDAKNGK